MAARKRRSACKPVVARRSRKQRTTKRRAPRLKDTAKKSTAPPPRPLNFGRYIHRVIKRQEQKVTITPNAVTVIDNMLKDVMGRIADEASNLAEIQNKKTLTERELEAAVRLVLKGNLGGHATNEGKKAVKRYRANVSQICC